MKNCFCYVDFAQELLPEVAEINNNGGLSFFVSAQTAEEHE